MKLSVIYLVATQIGINLQSLRPYFKVNLKDFLTKFSLKKSMTNAQLLTKLHEITVIENRAKNL